MEKTTKRWIIFGISVLVVLLITLFILAAYDKISLGASLATFFGIAIILFLIIMFFVFMKNRKKDDVERVEMKDKEPIQKDEAINIIKEDLKNNYADYIQKIDSDWTGNFGIHKKYPIFTLTATSKFNKGKTIVGQVNKITKMCNITYYNNINVSKNFIEKDSIEKANLLSGDPDEKSYRTTRRITESGSELTITEPVEKDNKDEEKKGGEIK